LTTWGRDSYGLQSAKRSSRVGSGTYPFLPAKLRQWKTEIEGLLEAAPGLPLGFAAGLGIASFAFVIGAYPLGALLISLGLGFGLGGTGAASDSTAGESILLRLELGSQTGIGVFARALTLLLLFGRGKRYLYLAIGAGVICVVGWRAPVDSVLRGRLDACARSWGGYPLGSLGGYRIETGLNQAFDRSLSIFAASVSEVGRANSCHTAYVKKTNLLLAKILVDGLLQALPDLFACYRLEVS
jgi:hypothetical protein